MRYVIRNTMANPIYTQEFIAVWRLYGERGRHRIARAAEQQTANLEATRSYGHWLADYGLIITDYEQSVRLLQEVASKEG